MLLDKIWLILTLVHLIQCNFQGFIVGGKTARIEDFPHSAFMAINCVSNDGDENWICSASILNQDILMTAAHCLVGCTANSQILIAIGHENKENGFKSSAHSFVTHDRYVPKESSFDIALVRMKTRVKFCNKIKRVALLSNPPYYETAKVAGWGLKDEIYNIPTDHLQFIYQHVWNYRECKKTVKKLTAECFCAKSDITDQYASFGDSGSALIVRDYIQIGIVSYKMASAKHVIVYTNVTYYLNWIQKTSGRLMCTK